jgi:O-antigen/teichoic acid export membrane protein
VTLEFVAGRGPRQNMASLYLVQVANIGFPLLSIPILTRSLGVESFGLYALAQTVVLLLVWFTDYGFNLSGVQTIAATQGKSARQSIGASIWVCKAALLLTSTLALLGLSVVVDNRLGYALLLFWPTLLASLIMPLWWLLATQRMLVAAVIVVPVRVCALVATYTVVQSSNDLFIAILISSLSPLAISLLIVLLLVLFGEAPLGPTTITACRQRFSEGAHVFLSTVAVSLYTFSTPVLLGSLSGPQAVGAFAAPDKVRAGLMALFNPLSNAALPRTSAAFAVDRPLGFRLARRLLVAQTSMMTGCAAVVFVFAEVICTLLFGEAFASQANLLRILALAPVLVAVSNVLGVHIMLPLGDKGMFLRITATAALVNILSLLILVPFIGPLGACVSLLSAEAIVTIIMLVTCAKRGWLTPLLRGKR